MATESKYIPAAGHDWLLPLYDPCISLLMPEKKVRGQLIEWTEIGLGADVLDLGSGTGTLAVMMRQAHPTASVVGLDGDPKAIAIARRKAYRAGVEVRFDEGSAAALPYEDDSFDRVVSSFVFHHLPGTVKHSALREVHRVLRADGLLVLQDFGPQVSRLERFVGRLVKGGPELQENLEGRLPKLIVAAGFADVLELGQRSIRIARLWTYGARK